MQDKDKQEMSSFGDYMKARAEKEDDFFFGAGNREKNSNKYFTFKHVLDNDNIIINTNNVKKIKDSFVLIVGNKEAVYLKDWQVRGVHNYSDICSNFYLVKLNRKYFKPYSFRNGFNNFCFDNTESFDDLMECAREQDEAGMKVAKGFMGY